MNAGTRLTEWQIVCEVHTMHPDWTVTDHVAYLSKEEGRQMRPPTDAGEEYLQFGPDIDCGPSLVWLVVVRVLVLAGAVGAMRLGLREWPTAAVALVVLGAAWVLGRVD
jgi:hypothetical protein